MKVVLLSARDPLQAVDATSAPAAAHHLASAGHEVVLVLLEEAVTLARDDHQGADGLRAAIAGGVRVLADGEALSRRAVERPGEGVKPTDLGEVVDLLFEWSDRQAWL